MARIALISPGDVTGRVRGIFQEIERVRGPGRVPNLTWPACTSAATVVQNRPAGPHRHQRAPPAPLLPSDCPSLPHWEPRLSLPRPMAVRTGRAVLARESTRLYSQH